MLRHAVAEADPLTELQPILYRFALRGTRDPELSRELVQEALLAAVAQRGEFAGRSSLRTWVIGILSHKVIDHFRRRSPDRVGDRAADDDDALLATPSSENVERVVAARQELARVERALEKLPELERLALLMTDVEGVEREKCCHVLGVTPTHLRVLIHRGRNRVRRMLEDGK